ncbi:MAG: hypothetical protein ACI4N4_02935 [Candidatus Fimenecus sp.]
MTKSFGYLPKSQKILWIVLRAVIICWGVFGLFHGSVVEFLEAIFAVIFTHLWDFFQIFGKKSFIIEVDYSAQTMLTVFIFVAVVIGSTVNNRTTFQHIDVLTHLIAGFISAWFGYDFANIVYRKRGDLGPAMSSLFALTFALALSVGWEIYEFSMDRIYGMNLQCSAPDTEYGLIDTMCDFIVCSVGSVLGMFTVSFLRNGIIGKNKERVKEQRRLENEKRLLKDKLYKEYMEKHSEEE